MSVVEAVHRWHRAIDGIKLKAVNHRDKNFTNRKLRARMQQLEQSIALPAELDRDASTVPLSRDLKEKLAKVKEQMRSLGEIGEQMKSSVDGQLSMTDSDAKAGTWHRLTLNDRIGERATTGAQPGYDRWNLVPARSRADFRPA